KGCQHKITRLRGLAISKHRDNYGQGKEREENFVNKVAGEENEGCGAGSQCGCNQRAHVAQLPAELEQEPDNSDTKQRRDESDGNRAQAGFAEEQRVDSGRDATEIVECGSVKIGGIVVVVTGAEQVGEELPIYAFVVVQRLQ